MRKERRLDIFKENLREIVSERKNKMRMVHFSASPEKYVVFFGSVDELVCDVPRVELSMQEEKRLLTLDEFSEGEGLRDPNTNLLKTYQTRYSEEDIDKAVELVERIFIEVFRFPAIYDVSPYAETLNYDVCPECKAKEDDSNKKMLSKCILCNKWFCSKHLSRTQHSKPPWKSSFFWLKFYFVVINTAWVPAMFLASFGFSVTYEVTPPYIGAIVTATSIMFGLMGVLIFRPSHLNTLHKLVIMYFNTSILSAFLFILYILASGKTPSLPNIPFPNPFPSIPYPYENQLVDMLFALSLVVLASLAFLVICALHYQEKREIEEILDSK